VFKNTMLTLVCVGVILNLALTLYTLNMVKNASGQLLGVADGAADRLNDVSTVASHLGELREQLSSLTTLADTLADAIGPTSRLAFNLFPISIPNLVNEVLRQNFKNMAQNVTKLALGVEKVMRLFNQGHGMLDTARYASLVSSVSKQVTYLKPVRGQGAVPPEDPANNDLVHMVVSGLFNVIDFEVDSAKPWRRLASTCMDFVDNFSAVNWSGVYYGARGQRMSWSVNNQITEPLRVVFDYCSALANLTGGDTGVEPEGFSLNDVLDMLGAGVDNDASSKLVDEPDQPGEN